MSNTALVARVIEKIIGSEALRKSLETSHISWSTTYVKIEDTLNEALPHKYEEVQYGVRKLTETEYTNRLRRWHEKTVNGRVVYLSESKKNGRGTSPSKPASIGWIPPEHSHLYKLTRHIQEELNTKQLCCEYYLLHHEERFLFLKKKFGKGKENALRILTGECSDPQFTETLKRFLSANV